MQDEEYVGDHFWPWTALIALVAGCRWVAGAACSALDNVFIWAVRGRDGPELMSFSMTVGREGAPPGSSIVMYDAAGRKFGFLRLRKDGWNQEEPPWVGAERKKEECST